MQPTTYTKTTEKTATLETWSSQLNIRELYVQYGTPSWIVSAGQLRRNTFAFSRFTGSPGHILFPIKTNPSLTVLEQLARLGVGADCANKHEIDLAAFAGMPWEKISYNCPVQDVCLSVNLLNKGAIVVMDDPLAIAELQRRMKGRHFPGKLWLRVNPGTGINYTNKNDNQELMSHAASSSKFGIPAEEMVDLVKELNFPVSGLHVHVGTQMDNLESFRNSMHQMVALANQLKALNHPVADLDIGGGLGIPFLENDNFPSLTLWVEEMNKLKDNDFRYFVEPGHALVGNAVALLTKVETIKNSRGKRWFITDVGTDQLAKVTLLRWPHRILGPDGNSLSVPGKDAVAGPLCFAGDTLLDNIDAGELQIKDPLLITHAGAYTYSLSNRFNGRQSPAWVIIDDDGHQKRMNIEGRYDNPQYTNYFWDLRQEKPVMETLTPEKIAALSSTYLTKWAEEDQFEYLNISQTGDRSYEIDVMTRSRVDFISMPFAIRIFGDAVIVALLHHMKAQKKELPIWGRKLNLDCFGQVRTGIPLRFRISFGNHMEELNGTNSILARFETECWNCSGSLVLKF
ncbi:MAG: diaminopimelate decarboxylase family protein [Bacteroidota bacterium]